MKTKPKTNEEKILAVQEKLNQLYPTKGDGEWSYEYIENILLFDEETSTENALKVIKTAQELDLIFL